MNQNIDFENILELDARNFERLDKFLIFFLFFINTNMHIPGLVLYQNAQPFLCRGWKMRSYKTPTR